jgi:tyrosine-specific transport protein
MLYHYKLNIKIQTQLFFRCLTIIMNRAYHASKSWQEARTGRKMKSLFKSKTPFGGAILVTGCCIGAGMIGLPVMSALAGFMPSTLAMIFCYLFTTITGLLILEATLWFQHKVNLSSIVEATLGKTAKVFTLSLFAFLFYCLFVAYLDGGGTLFADLVSSVLHTNISHTQGVFICLFLVAGISYIGTHLVDHVNKALMIGLIVSYCFLVFVALPYVSKENLAFADYNNLFATIPILLICFGYQNLVPSLTYYLEKQVKTIRFAIIIGNLIPFFIYFLWNFVILGILSPSQTGSAKEVDMVTQLLQETSHSIAILFFIKSFSLFAMLTSFLPNTISFVDFLKDGFKNSISLHKNNNLIFFGIVFLPPLICTLLYPHLFLEALGFAGGFIDVLLFGVVPALVILVGRNFKKLKGPYLVAGGNLTPIFILVVSLIILIFRFL